MKLGDAAVVSRRFDPAALARFCHLAGATTLGGALPDPLIAALFSYLLGMAVPGAGTNYLKQEMEFLRAVPADTVLTATVEVVRLRPEKHLVDLATVCRDTSGAVVCRGRALVLFREAGDLHIAAGIP